MLRFDAFFVSFFSCANEFFVDFIMNTFVFGPIVSISSKQDSIIDRLQSAPIASFIGVGTLMNTKS